MTDKKRAFRPPWIITRNMVLTDAEVERLMDHVQHVCRQQSEPGCSQVKRARVERDRLIVASLLFSGLRNSELCRLRLRDTIVETGESVFLVWGTPRQDRAVHVPQFLSLLVQTFAHVHRDILARGETGRDSGNRTLLVNDRGRPFERTSLYRRVVRILESAGLGDRASVQLLRHTYGYLAYKHSGGNLLFVQRQMGHAHPMVTALYSQFVVESYPEIANRVALAAQPPLAGAKPDIQKQETSDVRIGRNSRQRSRRNSRNDVR